MKRERQPAISRTRRSGHGNHPGPRAPRATQRPCVSRRPRQQSGPASRAQDRRAGLAVTSPVARLQAGDGPGLGQLPAEGTRPAAACQQARSLGPAAGQAKLLGPRDDHSLIGPQLENAGELGLAVGLAAELAVHGRTFFTQMASSGRAAIKRSRYQRASAHRSAVGAFAGAVSLEVQDLLARAQPLSLLVVGGGLVELVGQRPRPGPAGIQEPVIRPGGDQAVEVPDRREGVAVLLGLVGSSAHARRDRHRAARRRDRAGRAARAGSRMAGPSSRGDRQAVSMRRPVRASIRTVRSSRLESWSGSGTGQVRDSPKSSMAATDRPSDVNST